MVGCEYGWILRRVTLFPLLSERSPVAPLWSIYLIWALYAPSFCRKRTGSRTGLLMKVLASLQLIWLHPEAYEKGEEAKAAKVVKMVAVRRLLWTVTVR